MNESKPKKNDDKYLLCFILGIFYLIFIYANKSKLNAITSILITLFCLISPIFLIILQSLQLQKFKKPTFFQNMIIRFIFITGVLFYLSYVIELFEARYVYYGKILISLYGFSISTILTAFIILICKVKNKSMSIFILISLTIFITPILSSINTSFNVQEIKTISATVINTKTTTSKGRDKYYYIYIDKSRIPGTNNKFRCSKKFQLLHPKNSEVSITYKKGLLGLQYIELNRTN